jgi:sugar lactone lactonase YvrE
MDRGDLRAGDRRGTPALAYDLDVPRRRVGRSQGPRRGPGLSWLLVVAVAVVALSGTLVLVALDRPLGGPLAPRDALLTNRGAVRAEPLASPLPSNPYSTDMNAALVLGQGNFSTANGGVGKSILSGPDAGLAFNASGDLWVVDGGNNRVLSFNAPFSDGEPASIVLGQSLFTSRVAGTPPNASNLWEPQGVGIDAHGDVWIADSENNRVLEYVPPLKTDMAASLVLGQAVFTTGTAGTTATTMNHPTGLAFDSAGDLWVADSSNNRILEFVPGGSGFVSGMAATLVLGQVSFTTSSSTVNASTLRFPTALAFSPTGSLWVADTDHDRAVEFAPPFATGERGSLALGENNFTTTTEPLPNGMFDPDGVAVDLQGNVWVADEGPPDRVAEFRAPITFNESPSVVLGQPNNTSIGCGTGPTASDLCAPSSVVVGPSGNLWAFDAGHYRVLAFVPATYSWTFTETGLASGTKWSVTVNGTTLSNTTSGGSGKIVFVERNGSYSFSVASVAGYTNVPSSGPLTVNGTQGVTTVAFSSTILGLLPVEFGLLLLLLLLIVAAIVAVLLLRRRSKGRSPPPPPLKPSPAAPPPSTLPPWHEGPPEPPPPGVGTPPGG